METCKKQGENDYVYFWGVGLPFFFLEYFFTVLGLFFRILSQFAAPFKSVFKEETCSLEKGNTKLLRINTYGNFT